MIQIISASHCFFSSISDLYFGSFIVIINFTYILFFRLKSFLIRRFIKNKYNISDSKEEHITENLFNNFFKSKHHRYSIARYICINFNISVFDYIHYNYKNDNTHETIYIYIYKKKTKIITCGF